MFLGVCPVVAGWPTCFPSCDVGSTVGAAVCALQTDKKLALSSISTLRPAEAWSHRDAMEVFPFSVGTTELGLVGPPFGRCCIQPLRHQPLSLFGTTPLSYPLSLWMNVCDCQSNRGGHLCCLHNRGPIRSSDLGGFFRNNDDIAWSERRVQRIAHPPPSTVISRGEN